MGLQFSWQVILPAEDLCFQCIRGRRKESWGKKEYGIWKPGFLFFVLSSIALPFTWGIGGSSFSPVFPNSWGLLYKPDVLSFAAVLESAITPTFQHSIFTFTMSFDLSPIRSLDLTYSVKETAIANLNKWLEGDEFADYKPQLEDLIKRQEWRLLVDSFYQNLPFGTGGQRGSVGIGTNRFNPATLAGSIQGHVEYLKHQKEEKGWGELSVVVAFDVRQFNDSKGLYSQNIPNPVLGLRSRDFARSAAGIYAANGVKVWTLPEDEDLVLATPELSFLIRHLGAQGGLNISASHNPPDDNGAKIYNYTGGQEVPPNDETMVKLVDQVDEVKQMDFEKAESAGLIAWVTSEHRHAYIDVILASSLQPEKRSATIVFSPLHGAGKSCAAKAIEAAGFNVIRVEEQWANDGDFPTVPGHVANPEEPPAMVLGAQKAKAAGADIFMATDPDADRMGAIAPDSQGVWHFLDGNQIGTILTYYILSTKKEQGTLPSKPLVISTEVTTSILRRISAAFGARNINDLLVGFKYIGDILKQIDETGAWEGEAFEIDDFIFGTEESHGYLVTHAIRDKDSAGACLLLAELAAHCKAEGCTVIDYLNTIYSEFGFTRNLLISVGLAGAEGKDLMQRMLNSYRENMPAKIGSYDVREMLDLQDPEVRFGPIKSETDRASRNVLVFHMQDGQKGVIRPSGTEPKTKIYFEATGQLSENETLEELKARIDSSLREFAQVFAEEMLRRGDITPDTPGVKVSGIEALEKKLKFAEFMEE